MKNQLLHTPDGVRDLYNGECQQKLILEKKLHSVLRSYGYHDIQTPSFEYFPIFGNEIGTTPPKDLYKFFDKEGNTLALRPDFTPSVARCAVKYFMDEDLPVKLCYKGNTFINSSDYQGHLKENTQCGAELIGDSSVAADAEILAMAVSSLTEVGLRNFQISVGHAGFFPGLVKAAGMDEDTKEILYHYIQNKNFLGVEDVIEMLHIEPHLKALFMLLGQFNANASDLDKAKEDAAEYPEILSCINELQQLDIFIRYYGIEKYISYELGIISDFSYYTGIIFHGYTFGTGEPIVNGGRYDKLLSYFGKTAPAIGFAIVVDQLMTSLNRQKIQIPVLENNALIVFEEKRAKEAVKRASELRSRGIYTELLLKNPGKSREAYSTYAVSHHMNKVEFMD